jgi:hypothetical protein
LNPQHIAEAARELLHSSPRFVLFCALIPGLVVLMVGLMRHFNRPR